MRYLADAMHPEKGRSEYQTAVGAIKRRLKLQGIAYRVLAAELGLSESGLKKALGSRDGSFQRLVEICDILGVTLVELLAGESERPHEVVFTEAQEIFLGSSPDAFALFWRLVYERRSVAEAQRLGELNEALSFKLLRQLDRLDLLKLLPGGEVRVPAVRPVTWTGGRAFVRRVSLEFGLKLVRAAATAPSTGSAQYVVRYFQLLPKTYREFLEAQRELEGEFLRRSIREMRLRREGLLHVRWVSACDDRSFLDPSLESSHRTAGARPV